MTGKDMLLLPDGSTYHLGAKKGDIYPRIVTVGSPSRAEAMSKCLDTIEKKIISARQFHIYSGKYKNVGVTIVAIGMGAPMMDFLIREASFICEGPMAVIRVGTCGIFNPLLLPGTVVVASKGCSICYINHGAWTDGCMNATDVGSQQYLISKPVPGTPELCALLTESLKAREVACYDGLNVAGDYFYSTQGRKDSHFDDGDNQGIFDCLLANKVDTMEMESFTLYQLGRQRKIAPLYTAACHIGILNRANPEITTNIGAEELHKLETESGFAALEALIQFNKL